MMKTQLEQHHYQRLEEVNQDYVKYIYEMKRLIQTMEHLADMGENEEVRRLTKQLPVRELITG